MIRKGKQTPAFDLRLSPDEVWQIHTFLKSTKHYWSNAQPVAWLSHATKTDDLKYDRAGAQGGDFLRLTALSAVGTVQLYFSDGARVFSVFAQPFRRVSGLESALNSVAERWDLLFPGPYTGSW
jgi:hypothetical protein